MPGLDNHDIGFPTLTTIPFSSHQLDISCRSFRSVPLITSLLWLPVPERIMFKICTITCQSLTSKQPQYLLCMLTPARLHRQLRSLSSHLFADSSFSQPIKIKSGKNIITFRRHIKIYLFNVAYLSVIIQLIMTYASALTTTMFDRLVLLILRILAPWKLLINYYYYCIF